MMTLFKYGQKLKVFRIKVIDYKGLVVWQKTDEPFISKDNSKKGKQFGPIKWCPMYSLPLYLTKMHHEIIAVLWYKRNGLQEEY